VRRQLVLLTGCALLAGVLAGVIPAISAAQSGKVVVIMEENEPYDSIVGNNQAPYLNQLISQGKLFTNFTGIADGSHPNYIAQTSGLSPSQNPPTQNIFQAIDAAGGGLTWKEFMESAPGNCATGTSTNIPGTSVPLYTADHDPAYAYQSNTTCSVNDVPMTSSTFNPASLPSFSYIVPNQCDDMHTLPGSGQSCPAYFGSNTGSNLISLGDSWLATVVPQLLAQPGVTVLITWDEGSVSTTPPMHLAAVEAGAGVTPGSTDGTAYNHYGIEAGLYSYFGLGTAPNNGATATPVPFGGPAPSPSPSTTSPSPSPTPTSPSPSPTSTCSAGITVDPSSPAAVHGNYGVGSVSTASFSPPAGALLEVMVDALHSGVTVTLSDSKGGTYTAGPHIQGTTQAGSIYFFQRYLPSAPGPMTVTASQSGSARATISLAVQVLDNAAQVQTGGAAAAATGNGTSQYGSLTTTQTGSWAYVVIGTGDAGETVTPLSTTSNVDVWNDSSQSGNFAAMGRSASATGTPAATNFGWTGNHSDNFVWAAQEILPASCSTTSPSPTPSTTSPSPTPSTTSPSPTPSTTSPSPTPTATSPSPTPTSPSPSPTGTCPAGIAVDPSSPAAVHSTYGASSLSTASFSPPAGSLLEVMVDALHSGVAVTLADSRGGTYTAGPHIQGTTQAGSIYFFQRYLPGAPGPMTVTAAQSGSSVATMTLAVQVLDNAAPVQTSAAAATTTGNGTSQYGSLTTTQPGSWAYAVVGTGDATETVTALSTTSNVDVWNDSSQSGNLAAMGRSASATGTPAVTHFGWTGNHSDNFVWAAQEILPAPC
jgi:hypothetical protein